MMTTPSHQSRLRIFTHCSPVLHGINDGMIPVKGEDIFNKLTLPSPVALDEAGKPYLQRDAGIY